MSIRRSSRKTNYTTIDNMVFTSGLSYRAIGLLAYLLSKPDNWEVSVAQLVKQVKESGNPTGRDAVYSIIGELEEKGFIVRKMKRTPFGKMAGVEYVVHDTPQEKPEEVEPFTAEPEADNPQTAEPFTANPTLINTEVKTNTDVSTNTELKQTPTAPEGVQLEHDDHCKSGKKKKTGSTSMDSFDLSGWPSKPSEQIWSDWVKNRKQLRAAITQTAITRLGNQLTLAAQSGYSVDECLGKCVERGWRGFEARWMVNADQSKNRPGYFRPDAAPVNYHEGIDEDGRF